MVNIKELTNEEYIFGSLTCAGCGGSLAVRLALKVLGKRTVIVTPPCCLMGVTTFYPQMAFSVPCVTTVLPGTASVISGIVAGLNKRGDKDFNVVGLAGDGGTVDIGLQALSGAMERGEKFIFLCYDNEAYMNTGIQKSGATPYGAVTTTTPGGKNNMWEERPKKDMISIAVDHNIPYAATACVSYPTDFMAKVEKAKEAPGPAYIQVLAPCPTGWGFKTDETINIGRLAVQTGVWMLAEYDKGEIRLTNKPKKMKPVEEYLQAQGRFSKLGAEEVKRIQSAVNVSWKKYLSG